MKMFKSLKDLQNSRASAAVQKRATDWLRAHTRYFKVRNKDEFIAESLRDLSVYLRAAQSQTFRNKYPELAYLHSHGWRLRKDVQLHRQFLAERQAREFNLNQHHTNLISLNNIPRNRKMQFNKQVYNAHSLANHIYHSINPPIRIPTVPHSRRPFTSGEANAILNMAKRTGWRA
jgi:hypothetical protein